MELRIYAPAEIRKGGSMSKAPDLSAFPIPRKGGARPIMGDAAEAAELGAGEAECLSQHQQSKRSKSQRHMKHPWLHCRPIQQRKRPVGGAHLARSNPPVRQLLHLQPMGRLSPPP